MVCCVAALMNSGNALSDVESVRSVLAGGLVVAGVFFTSSKPVLPFTVKIQTFGVLNCVCLCCAVMYTTGL